MSVNGVDYSNSLAKARDKYLTLTQEARDNFNQQKIDLENKHEVQAESQRKTFLKAKGNLEDRLEKMSADNNEKLNNNITKQTQEFNNKITEERENLRNDKKNTRAEFNGKFNRIRDSFDNSLNENNKAKEEFISKTLKNKKKSVNLLRDNFDQKIKDISTNERKSNDQVLKQASFERQKILNRSQKENAALIQNSNLAKNKLKNNHEVTTEGLRTNFLRNEERIKNQSDNRVENVINNKNLEIKNIQKEFVDLNDTLESKNERIVLQQKRDGKLAQQKMGDQFNKDRLSMERQTNRLINDGVSDVNKDKLESQETRFNTRISNLRNKMNDNNFEAKVQNEKIGRSFQGEIRARNLVTRKSLADQKRKFQFKIQSDKIEARDTLESVTSKYREALSNSENLREASGDKASSKLKNVVKEKEIEFAHIINEISDENSRQQTSLKDDYSQENINNYKKMQNQLSKDKLNIKKSLTERFTKTQEGLINALENKENQMLRIKDIYEKRISLLNSKNSNEVLTMQKNFVFQKQLNDTDTKQLIDDKQAEFTSTIKTMKNSFDKKILSIKNRNDIFVNKLTDKYENMLKTERSNGNKAMSRKDRWAQGEISRLRRQAKLEKNSLIQQYELKLDKIKQATALNKEISNSKKA